MLNYMCEINIKSVESCIICWEIFMIFFVVGEVFLVCDFRIFCICMVNLYDLDMLVLWLLKFILSGELFLRCCKIFDFVGGWRFNVCNFCNFLFCN